jgi:hypothetical protein
MALWVTSYSVGIRVDYGDEQSLISEFHCSIFSTFGFDRSNKGSHKSKLYNIRCCVLDKELIAI